MKRPVVSPACLKPAREPLLRTILRRCGAYYHSPDLFYQELWKQRMVNIGFRVLLVEKLSLHHLWQIRLCGGLSAQTYLLVSKPIPKRYIGTKDVILKQLRSEIQQIAGEMGPPIKADCVSLARTGAYFHVSFIWPVGKPGLLLKKEKRPEAFSFLIRPWLRRNRN